MHPELDDLSRPQVHALLEEHLRDMQAITPAGKVYALDLNKLRQPDVTFWTLWDGDEVLACGALKQLDAGHAEIKSMRTAQAHRRRGAARAMLTHLIAVARTRGYRRLSLETGSYAAFAPARRLYATAGFTICGPFGDYPDDPDSTFMTLTLD